VAVIGAVAIVAGCTKQRGAGSPSGTGATDDAEAAFRRVLPWIERGSVKDANDVRSFARMRGADPWIILLLTDKDIFYRQLPQELRESPVGRPDLHKGMQTGVIGWLLEDLGPDASTPVMLAVVTLLDDDSTEMYLYKGGVWPFETHVEALTRPLKDLAREALVRNLGVDCGFDKAKWQEKILSRHDNTVNSRK